MSRILLQLVGLVGTATFLYEKSTSLLNYWAPTNENEVSEFISHETRLFPSKVCLSLSREPKVPEISHSFDKRFCVKEISSSKYPCDLECLEKWQ